MFSHLWCVRVAGLIAATALLGACRTFSPDGGMDMVAGVAGTGLNKDVVQIRSAEDAAAVRARVTKLLHRPLGADAAVQIALLNNLGLQAAYNRLGIAEAVAVKASRPPSLSFARLMGLWQSDLDAYLPSSLPALPGSTRNVRAIEQDALNARVDVQMARAEMEAMAKSYGLTRKTHFLNVLDAAGISKTQKDRGEKRADGGGYELVLEVPLFDFGKANVREAEQRYLEAANRLGQLGVNAASEAREAYGAYRATYTVARKYEAEVLPLHRTISAETELQYNAMQIDAFALLQAAREQLRVKVAGIEAKRNFWLASTDLSMAVLGGGNIASEPDAVIAATSSSTNAE